MTLQWVIDNWPDVLIPVLVFLITVIVGPWLRRVIYYHTHHFIEEHRFLFPTPPNDFAVWVTDTLGEEVLGGRLNRVGTFSFWNSKGEDCQKPY